MNIVIALELGNLDIVLLKNKAKSPFQVRRRCQEVRKGGMGNRPQIKWISIPLRKTSPHG
jgi:hypothetical protein